MMKVLFEKIVENMLNFWFKPQIDHEIKLYEQEKI